MFVSKTFWADEKSFSYLYFWSQKDILWDAGHSVLLLLIPLYHCFIRSFFLLHFYLSNLFSFKLHQNMIINVTLMLTTEAVLISKQTPTEGPIPCLWHSDLFSLSLLTLRRLKCLVCSTILLLTEWEEVRDIFLFFPKALVQNE